MKLNRVEKILIVLFMTHWQMYLTSGFRLNDLCLKTLTSQCEHSHNMTCGKDHCAAHETSCKSFLKLNGVLSRISVEQLLDDQTRKYQKLFKRIKECPIMPHVCTNGVNCLQKQSYPMRNGKIKILIDIECPCAGKYPVKCEKSYCATSQEACEEISLVNSDYLAKIQKCGNDNRILYKNF